MTKTKDKVEWEPTCNWSPWKRQTPESLIASNANKDKAAVDSMLDALAVMPCWYNDHYIVQIRDLEAPDGWPEMVELAIRSQDNTARHDWRSMQKIKDDLIGKNCEAVELYPSHERIMDSANQFYLYACKKPGALFPIGRGERFPGVEVHRGVSEKARRNGVRQRPLDEPLP